LLGFLQTLPNPSVAEMAMLSGYDFLVLDVEHGVFEDRDILHTLQAVNSGELLTLVRLRGHETRSIGRYLDMDVDGVVVPNVSTAAQTKTLARAMEYPPRGIRGLGAALHRVSGYGADTLGHLRAARGCACLIVMIESALGLANMEGILAVEGVDGVLVGPYDLSADLGCVGDFSAPTYLQAMTRIESVAASHGVIYGAPPHPGHPVEALIKRGHRLLLIGVDIPLLREAMYAQVAAANTFL
jgi:2-keto-3-deoxy-L-rhamnonate aldolase RhmA